MKKTAKIISLAITFVMILSIVVTLAINAGAASNPDLNVSYTQKGNTVTAVVSVANGGINSLDGQFVTSGGATCTKIVSGSDWRDVDNANFVANKNNGKISAAATGTLSNGDFAVATFEVDDSKDYSIEFTVDVCKVLEDNDDVNVTPKINNASKNHTASSSSSSSSQSSSKSSSSSSSSSSKSSESQKSTESTKTTTTTTKPSTKTVIVTQIVTVTQPDGQPVTAANGQPATTVITEASVVNVDEAIVDESADGESPEYADTFGYDFSTTTTVKADGSKLISNSHINPKIVIPVAIAAAVIIAGIVAAVILVKKRGENEAESAAFADDFTDSFEPDENVEADIEDISHDEDFDVTDIDE